MYNLSEADLKQIGIWFKDAPSYNGVCIVDAIVGLATAPKPLVEAPIEAPVEETTA
jgi:hypothetical protein